MHAGVHTCPHYWETSLGHELPIISANTGNSMCPETFKNMIWVFQYISVYLGVISMLGTKKKKLVYGFLVEKKKG